MKKPKSFSEAIARELNPELHQPRQKSRGIRPSDNEIATALRATNGLFAQAAQRLLVSERSLRRWVSESEELTQLVESERELIIDLAELTIIKSLRTKNTIEILTRQSSCSSLLVRLVAMDGACITRIRVR